MASIINVDTINEKTTGNGVQIPGHVVQVKSVTKTDKQTVTSTAFVDVSGLSISITPSSSSSKILVTVHVHGGHNTANYLMYNIVRDSTAIGQSSENHLYKSTMNNYTGDNVSSGTAFLNTGMTLLDAPSTTNATTYKLQVLTTGGTAVVNGRPANTNGATISTITVMEIAQ